eukprot:Phypoly_transcript_04948.p1 GENE.Phypoly_transcript_04948~~Phypoly_transcript_04948.p1  ORF type:complete len:338 (+),score=9.47 Phypoly_transcript_04948:156-1169(+)
MVDWRNLSTRELHGHTKSVRCIKLSDSRLVSGSNDHTVKVWDISGKIASCVSLEGHSGGVTGVDAEGAFVVSGSWDGSIRLWEPSRTNKSLRILSGHNGPVLSVQLKDSTLASCSADRTLRLWRLHKSAQSEALEGHEEQISCMQFENTTLASGSYDGMAKLWDTTKAYCTSTLHGHTGPIQTLQMTGSLIVTGSFDRTVKIWDVVSGTCVHTMHEKSLIWKVCFCDTTSYFASGTLGGSLCMWDMRTNLPVFQTNAHNGCVKDLTFSTGVCDSCPLGGSHIVSGSSDSTVKVWCVLHAPDCAQVIRSHYGEVMCVQAGENRVASGGVDGKVCVCVA